MPPKATIEARQLASIQEAARLYHVHPDTIRRRISTGQLVGRRWQLDRSSQQSADRTPMSPEEKSADQALLARGRQVQARRRELRQATADAVNTVYDRWISPRGARR